MASQSKNVINKDKHAVNEIKTISNDNKPHWYIVQTYVGFEDAVRKTLEQKISNLALEDKILELFIPSKTVIKTNKKGDKLEKQEKVYPGYMYVHMILDKEVGYLMQNTQYVSKIAGTGDYAVALEDGYVDRLKENLLKEGQTIESASNILYQLGDLVKVVDGPFKDMQGKVCGIDAQNSRIDVLLSIFDRETRVELDILEVKRVIE
ncbi:MAG: KOW motif-containing protein [candidate division SR1 bacterium]|nr:KOW motif-containing protein [candidate division SR1 bacterium]